MSSARFDSISVEPPDPEPPDYPPPPLVPLPPLPSYLTLDVSLLLAPPSIPYAQTSLSLASPSPAYLCPRLSLCFSGYPLHHRNLTSQIHLRIPAQLHLMPLLRPSLISSPTVVLGPVVSPNSEANLPLCTSFGENLRLFSMDLQVIMLDVGRALNSQILAWNPLLSDPVSWLLPFLIWWTMHLQPDPPDPPDPPVPPDRRLPSWSVSVSLSMWFETYGSFSRLVTSYHLVMGCLPLPPSLSMKHRFSSWLSYSYLTGWVLCTPWFILDLLDSILGFIPHDLQVHPFRIPQIEAMWLSLSFYVPLYEDLYCGLQSLSYDISVYPGAQISLDFACPFLSFMEIVRLLSPHILCGIDVGSSLITSSETSVSPLSTGSTNWCSMASFVATVLAIVNCALDAVSIADLRTLHVITNFHGCNLSSTTLDVKFRGRLSIFSCLSDLVVSIYLLPSLYLAFVGLLCYFVNNQF